MADIAAAPGPQWREARGVQVLAHRGASRAARENTIEAFALARLLGADGVELDVRRTADGALVVHHDPRLDDGRVIAAVAVADLPAHVPWLHAALDACRGMWVNVEIKNDPDEPDFDHTDSIADETVAALRSRGDDGRWLISSFRWETIERCHQLAPSIATAWLTVESPDGVAARLIDAGHAAWHPWVQTLTEPAARQCRAAGIAVNTWTCDAAVRMAELIRWGIDGICTNVPDVARAVVDAAAADAADDSPAG